jgi:hypothetical protein
MSNRLLLNVRQTVRDRDDMMLPSVQNESGATPLNTILVESVEMGEVGSRASR